MPVLVLAGAESPAEIRDDPEAVVAALPKAQLIVIEGQEHDADGQPDRWVLVGARRPRTTASSSETRAALESFQRAIESGNPQDLLDVLAPDVVAWQILGFLRERVWP